MATVEGQTVGQVVLYNVAWSAYEALLAGTDRSGTRFTYSRGTLEIMSPSREHERLKRLIGRMIETLTDMESIPIGSGGSTTMKSEMKQRGLEPDECYYIANEARMRDRDHFDAAIDPPPDLVIEVDITSSSLNRMDIYAALGVPEIWRYDGKTLHVEELQADGSYARQTRSSTFPLVPPAEIERFLARRKETDETTLIHSFRDWFREQRSDR
ncbi:MAG: Uma2 family endonuclease [bacterium]|nr:Uma2 family endonuclease [bacterium]